MGIYLLDHPPARDQWRSRTRRPTGLTVIHTAENVTDKVGPDTGAEAVAGFIRGRSTPGCYHDLADSDSRLQLAPYEVACYHDGTGSNPFSLSISFALAAGDWSRLPGVKADAFLRNGAQAFAQQQAWLKRMGYPTTPIRRVSKADSSNGAAGFIGHGERDPGRRSDPGRDFNWDRFMQFCREATGGGAAPPAPGQPPATGRPVIRRGSNGEHVRALQDRLKRVYRTYAGHLVVDGDFGPGTEEVVKEFQRRSKLTADGIVGPATWRALGM